MTVASILTSVLLVFNSNEGTTSAVGDYPSAIGEAKCVVLDATANVQYEGQQLSYTWLFEDGSEAEGLSVEKCFDELGTYRATLTVTEDATGAQVDEAPVEIAIRSEAELNVKQVPQEDGTYQLAGNLEFSDANTEIKYYWDIDGSYHVGDAPEELVEAGTSVRLLAKFTYDGKPTQLAKTVTIGE
ncbi:PKD domain-containing protein [Marinoscillum furvescens]|uniref:PKD domain-containing protein n=1 Tax=Marinoscillum furvescens DSM 4134 TaxID=1122208 RepID=A0A3D9L413_MARFU|nr:PKD domain-containing protein [Marinoscillum furvescens]RED97088.1 hypothetical protein C7460_113137 [Marinoscillum furvescens DSM 4134]